MVVATFVLAVLMTVGFLLWALQTARAERDNATFGTIHENITIPEQSEKNGTP